MRGRLHPPTFPAFPVWPLLSLLALRTGLRISSFGEDQAGEIYIVDHRGGVYRLAASRASRAR
jgi:hypothetical protein